MKRILYLDYIKVIAIFCVIVYHCKIFEDNTFFGTVVTMGVPLFISVTGFLMLTKERKPSYYLKKNIKILFLIGFWGVISTVTSMFYRGDGFDVKTILSHVIHLDLYYCNHLWYLVALFAINVFCPLFVSYLNSPEKIKYVAGVTLIFPFFSRYLGKLNILHFTGSILLFYYFWGGYIILFMKKLQPIKAYLLLLIASLCIFVYVVCAQNLSWFIKTTGSYYYNIMNAIPIICLLEVLRRIPWRENAMFNYIGKQTLAIYLLQGPVYKGLEYFFPEIGTLHLLFPVIVLVLCLGITWLLDTNKYTRYVVSL